MKKIIFFLFFFGTFSLNAYAADVQRGVTYAADGEVTNTNLHQLVDDATVTDIEQADMATNYGLAFRSGTQPSDTDALWYDTGNTVLKVYDGSAYVVAPDDEPTFTSVTATTVTATTLEPTTISGNPTFSGNVSFSSNVSITGNASVSGNLVIDGEVTGATSFATGTLTITSTGNVSVTGVGFTPQAVIFIFGGTSAGNDRSSGMGVMTVNNQYSQESHSDNANHGGGISITEIVGRNGNGSPQIFAFDYVSMDSDGFTVNVSDADSNHTVTWLAIK